MDSKEAQLNEFISLYRMMTPKDKEHVYGFILGLIAAKTLSAQRQATD